MVKHWERKVVPSSLRVPVLLKLDSGASECGGLLTGSFGDTIDMSAFRRAECVVGQELTFSLHLPDTRKAIHIQARVIWTREYWATGCEFRNDPSG